VSSASILLRASGVSVDRHVLRLPAGEGIRVVALDLLADTLAAAVRLRSASAASDPDALHAFRIALRRLRSWMRAFRTQLAHSVPEAKRKGLRDVAHATTVGRDLDLVLELLRDVAPDEGGSDWLEARKRKRATAGSRNGSLPDRFESIASVLERRLGSYRAPGSRQRRETLGRALASAIPEHAEKLDSRLKKVRGADRIERTHKARLSAKHLRYLIEPVAAFVAKGEKLRQSLMSLQDDLGELHDLQVLREEVTEAMEEASAARRASLRQVEERVEKAESKAYRRVRRRWPRARRRRLVKQATVLARRLRAR
jgi:CHAD domain-containing protein